MTTTPLQALSLLNNSFMLRMSERQADKLRRGAIDHEVAQFVEQSLGRKPSAAEVAVLRRFAEQHGAPTRVRVLFNSNEFLYVE